MQIEASLKPTPDMNRYWAVGEVVSQRVFVGTKEAFGRQLEAKLPQDIRGRQQVIK